MRKKRFSARVIFLLLASLAILVLALAAQPERTQIVTGQSGELAVVEMGGRSYVAIEALTQLVTDAGFRLPRPGPPKSAVGFSRRINRSGQNGVTVAARLLSGSNRTRTYMPPDALDNDALDQRILNCAHSLAAMAASGQFVNDASCH